MRIGVYVDGYNLYYGAKRQCGSGAVSWKWFNPRGIAESGLNGQLAFAASQGWAQMTQAWTSATVSRVVYCTARVDASQNLSAHTDQDIYLKGLVASSAVDHIEYGNYVARTKVAPLAVKAPRSQANSGNSAPRIVTSDWPVMVKDQHGNDVPNATFMVSYLHNEEKGSDVNVASHLLIDIFDQQIDGAVVVSNDSDLKFPIAEARRRIPVGVLNPSGRYTAADLQPPHQPGQGVHWNRKLHANDFTSNQMPDPAGIYHKPAGW